jgi:teichuronic acid biosynthesis glycosyltransferase TuaH
VSAGAARAPGAWVFLGGVPWDSPWLNDQHLAHALAAEDRVLYVEPPRSPLTGLRGGGERGPRRPRLARREGGVHVLTTVALPKVGDPRSQRLSAPLLRAQVRWAARRAGLGPVAATVGMGPSAVWLRGAAGERLFAAFVSDWLEAGGGLLGADRATLASASRRLWRTADLLLATSEPIRAALAAEGFPAVLLPHGFDAAVAPIFDSAGRPPEYEGAGRPVMVVAGRLNGRVDAGLLDAVAAARPEGTLFLIGPLRPRDATPELRALLARENVVHLPTKAREALPPYLRHADLLLVPYVADEWSRYSSPMKVWDYLYAGAPLAGQGCPPLAELGEPVAFAGEGRGAVLEAVERALSPEAGNGVAAARRAIARANTWQDRAARLRTAVAARIAELAR